MKKIEIIILAAIVFLGAFLRIYKLDSVPPSLNWDEVAAGYNAYTIANWGADEYGIKMPLVFKSFGDDKHPVHIYITAVFIKIFGLSEFITRLPSAIIGIVAVAAIYFLVTVMFKNKAAGLLSSFFLAVSPYHLQLSRGLWEANFALSFYILGLLMFYLGIKRKYLFPLSFLSFGLSFFSYHSAKVLIPATIILLLALYAKDFVKNKIWLGISLSVIALFTFLTINNPKILGFARIEQNKIQKTDIENTYLFKKTGNSYLATVEITFNHYKPYFNPKYLFISGDENPRNSVNKFGQFYKVDLILMVAGLIALFSARSRSSIILGSWILLAPLPAAFAGGPQNAIRGVFMLGGMTILAGLGAGKIISLFKNKIWRALSLIIILAAVSFEFGSYLKYYYKEYAKDHAIEWQYGMEQIVNYLKRNPDYSRVYMDKIRQQPYIFFLYYLKTPLPELLATVNYDKSESRSYNSVESFAEYQFGGNWDIINSYPYHGVIYVMTPSYYSGLRYINEFEVKKLIKYPGGTDAFYIVEGNLLW
ncbi:MAG: Glycosyl transferase family 39 [uncultured bacterium]|nr:MAG: Glycosyl transferase family 39 [uncultured bacterium]